MPNFSDTNTLYLSNLSSKPASLARFKKLLLSHINPNFRSSDPNNDLIKPTRFVLKRARAKQPCFLDEQYGLLDISRYGSCKLRNSCFVTFIDSQSCENFKDKFSNKLVMGGRLINIAYAKKPSYLSLYHKKGPKEVECVLRQKKRSDDSDDLQLKKERRRLRRARSKLRCKGLPDSEINAILSESKDQKQANKKPVRKVVELIGNPPHTILLVQKLPSGITEQELFEIFTSHGFKEIRLVSVRNLCFVEYNSVQDATKVIDRLGTAYNINGHEISIGYAKK